MVGASHAATVSGITLGGLTSGLPAFNGISNNDNAAVNGFVLTPPDQGLCIGNDPTLFGDPKVVFEPVNEVVLEATPNGTPVRPVFGLATLFNDPSAEGDVRCVWDPVIQTFFFTEIGFVNSGPAVGDTTIDVAVLNRFGIATYQFDSSQGGTCFGDQPKTGFNNNALIVSTDQFCGPGENFELGALAVIISKSQLWAEDPTVNEAAMGPLSLAGIPITGLDPAINTGNNTAYFVNSFPFLNTIQTPNPADDRLGLWTLYGSASVPTGVGAISLTGTVIGSEPYAFPVPATSTGTGKVTIVDGTPVTSEAALNPDDSRFSGPVGVTRSIVGGLELWTALCTALTPVGDTTVRDGGAWFKIDVNSGSVAQQGYIATPGAYLIYPAIGAPQSGSPVAVFTITSKTINPSPAYSFLGSSQINTVAAGAGPHVSFSDALFDEARWGDYSFAQVDPSGVGIWVATEYIPPTAFQNPLDNWGTYVWQINQFSG